MKKYLNKKLMMAGGIVAINLLFLTFAFVFLTLRKSEEPMLTKVILDQNFSEKTMVIFDNINLDSVEAEGTFEDDKTIIYLKPGAYNLSYDNGGPDLEIQEIIVPNLPEFDVVTVPYVSEQTPVLSHREINSLSSPMADKDCEGWTWSRGFSSWHGGADFAKPGGCWIVAAGDGVVLKAEYGNLGEGYYVLIDHGNGVATKYSQGDGKFEVKEGDTVKSGERIMYMGTSGNSTGTHLHFEVLLDGVRVDPEKYIKF